MKAFSNVLFILAGIAILSGIAFFGYRFYQKLNAPAESPFKAIPQNTALIIRMNKPSHFWQETRESNHLWNDLFTIPYLNELRKQVNFLDSITFKDQALARILKSNPLLITVSPTTPNVYGLMYLINYTEENPDESFEQFVEKTFPSGVTIIKNGYGGSTISHVLFKNHRGDFFYSNKSGIFLASVHETLIKQALDRLSLNLNSQDDPSFEKILTRSGKNVDVNIFINYNSIAPVVAGLTTHGKLAEFLNVSNFAAWSGLDVIQRQDQWLISGYTVCDDTISQYLSLFSGQQPQQMEIQGIIPDNASSFTWIALENPREYLDNLARSKAGTSIYLSGFSGLMQFETENRVILRDHFLPWMGNEIGAVTLLNPVTMLPGEIYGLFKVSDRELADSLLKGLGGIPNSKPQSKSDKGSQIFNLNIPSVVPGVWGNLFQRLRGSYYVFLSDYVIFGNTPQSIEQYIDKVSSGNIIGKNPGFSSFRENISSMANLCFYYNTSGSFEELRTFLHEGINKEITTSVDTLKKFSSFGVQIINNGEDFITNLFIQHTRQEKVVSGPMVWQTALDHPVAGKPRFFPADKNGSLDVVVFDNANTLYLLDQDGKIKWKLKIPGKPIGEICKVGSARGDSIRIAFNTEDQICIVDMNGLFTNNSPFRLPLKASAGLACPAGDILYLQLSDKRIHAFDLHGKAVKGWEKPALSAIATRPVQYISSNGTDYYILTAKNGQTMVCNKNGRQVIKPAGKALFSPSSLFYLNKTNSKGELLSSSFDGKLVYLRSDGKTSDLKFNNFTPNHVFYYADINSDKVQEFIYYDLNKVYCYNRFQKLLFDYIFPTAVLEPVMASGPTGEFILGTVSPKTGEIFLFGKKGLIDVDPAVKGNTPFDMVKMDGNEGLYLVIGSGNTVRKYLLPQK